MIDAPTFRADYAEFANTTTFPDSAINYWIGIGTMLLTDRWGVSIPAPAQSPSTSQCFYDYGMELFVAHNLVLEATAMRDASIPGSIPGVTKGPIAGTAAGDVSVNYAPQLTVDMNDGIWNSTVYGQRFIRLAKMVGGGGLYIGAGSSPYDPLSSGNAWPGVLTGTPPWFT